MARGVPAIARAPRGEMDAPASDARRSGVVRSQTQPGRGEKAARPQRSPPPAAGSGRGSGPARLRSRPSPQDLPVPSEPLTPGLVAAGGSEDLPFGSIEDDGVPRALLHRALRERPHSGPRPPGNAPPAHAQQSARWRGGGGSSPRKHRGWDRSSSRRQGALCCTATRTPRFGNTQAGQHSSVCALIGAVW
mgnify:CR=1 FL=1